MKTYYYHDFSDNLVETKNQSKKVPENYKWVKKNPFYIGLGWILFQILKLVGLIYGKFALGLKIIGKRKLKIDSGYYIFANHTQPLGDVFNPALYSVKKPYYICDSSNLGIPILGPILPLVGALPIPESIRGKKKLFDAISYRAKSGNAIIIYPEAHVWPYCTFIRPFETTAFNFPIRDNLPSFTATTIYKKRKFRKKPRTVIKIDGPFYPNYDLEKKERIRALHMEITNQLVKRTQESNIEYIRYEKKDCN